MKKVCVMPFVFCSIFLLFLSVRVCVFTSHAAASSGAITLQETLQNAFAYSPNIKAAQESRQQSVHTIRMAQAGYYPTIGIWAGAGIQQADNVSTRASRESEYVVGAFTTGIQFSQTLWQGGNTSAQVRMRQEELNFRAWKLMDSATSLAYSAISAHADILRRKELVRLSEVNVRENKHILHLLRTRVTQGLSSEGDVKLVEGRLARAEATLSSNKQGLHVALANYLRVTGQPAPSKLASVTLPQRIITNVNEARNISVNKNERIQADLAAIRNAVADVDVARSQFSPRVSLDAGPSFVDQGYKGESHQFTWSAMINLQWEIFSGGRDVADVKSRNARVRELREILHQTMDQVNEEILITHASIQSSAEQEMFYTKAARAARAAKKNYDAQFEVGQKDLLSVLDAEGEYFFSASEAIIRKTDVILGQYRMLALTGELLEELGIDGGALQIDTSKKTSSETFVPWSFTPSTIDTQEALSGTTLTQPQ